MKKTKSVCPVFQYYYNKGKPFLIRRRCIPIDGGNRSIIRRLYKSRYPVVHLQKFKDYFLRNTRHCGMIN